LSNLSPFATCDDKPFKCGDRKFFQKLFSSQNIILWDNSLYCGDVKVFVATKVANVATRNFGLDNADIEL